MNVVVLCVSIQAREAIKQVPRNTDHICFKNAAQNVKHFFSDCSDAMSNLQISFISLSVMITS